MQTIHNDARFVVLTLDGDARPIYNLLNIYPHWKACEVLDIRYFHKTQTLWDEFLEDLENTKNGQKPRTRWFFICREIKELPLPIKKALYDGVSLGFTSVYIRYVYDVPKHILNIRSLSRLSPKKLYEIFE